MPGLAPAPSRPPIPPPLSPGFVKETISDLVACRRALVRRFSTLDLFREQPRNDDPPEIQMLFAARDDYLQSTSPLEKAGALRTMTAIAKQIRDEGGAVANEMNKMLTVAMQSEVAHKRINVMEQIARQRYTKNAAAPSLSELIEEMNSDDPDRRAIAAGSALSGKGRLAETDDGERCVAELPPESDTGSIPPE